MYMTHHPQQRAVWEDSDPDAAARSDARGPKRWLKGCKWFKTLDELSEIWEAGLEKAKKAPRPTL